jgi:hypothetical protein
MAPNPDLNDRIPITLNTSKVIFSPTKVSGPNLVKVDDLKPILSLSCVIFPSSTTVYWGSTLFIYALPYSFIRRKELGNDPLDLGMGLAFSLSILERYQKNGLLQAELHHVPGIKGRCMGYIQLVKGKVASCSIEKNGQHQLIGKDILIRVDNERGPFEWKLTALPEPPSPTPRMEMPMQDMYSPVPRKTASLERELERLTGWTSAQKHMLSTVYGAIDGRRSIDEIKKAVPLAPGGTDEALRILLALRVIIIPLQQGGNEI